MLSQSLNVLSCTAVPIGTLASRTFCRSELLLSLAYRRIVLRRDSTGYLHGTPEFRMTWDLERIRHPRREAPHPFVSKIASWHLIDRSSVQSLHPAAEFHTREM